MRTRASLGDCLGTLSNLLYASLSAAADLVPAALGMIAVTLNCGYQYFSYVIVPIEMVFLYDVKKCFVSYDEFSPV